MKDKIMKDKIMKDEQRKDTITKRYNKERIQQRKDKQ